VTQMAVTCCVSTLARFGLTRIKEKKQRTHNRQLALDRALGNVREFTDRCLTTDHPYVSQSMLKKLSLIDSRLFLCWELQHYFDHRWHIKLRDENGDIKSVLILQHPWTISLHQQADFIPFDSVALSEVRRCIYQLRHGTQAEVIKKMQDKQEKKEVDRQADLADLADVMDAEQRHIQERLMGKRNISDPGWERGIGWSEDGRPYVEGFGAHTDKVTKAI